MNAAESSFGREMRYMAKLDLSEAQVSSEWKGGMPRLKQQWSLAT